MEPQTTQYAARMTIEEQLLPENEDRYLGKFTTSELLDYGYTANSLRVMNVFNDMHKQILRIFRNNNIELKYIAYSEIAPGCPAYDFQSDDVMIVWKMEPRLSMFDIIVKLMFAGANDLSRQETNCNNYKKIIKSNTLILPSESVVSYRNSFGLLPNPMEIKDHMLSEISKLAEKVSESNITLK